MKFKVGYYIPLFYMATVMGLPFLQAVAVAEEGTVCFQILPSGQVVDLSRLCVDREGQKDKPQNSGMVMNSQQLYERGFELGRRRLYKEAINDFTEAIRANPDYVEAYIARAYAYGASGNLQQAVKDFEQTADIYRKNGDSEKAEMMQRTAEDARRELRELGR